MPKAYYARLFYKQTLILNCNQALLFCPTPILVV